MDETEIRSFISAYTSDDEPRIRFDWNGLDDDDFADRNQVFREAVLDAVEADAASAPILLIRDLYRAETEFSTEAWCIDGRVSELAEQLLRRGGDEFVMDYIEGRSRSFDAYMGSAFEVDPPLAARLLGFVQARLNSETDESRIELLKQGETWFQEWVDDSKSRPT